MKRRSNWRGDYDIYRPTFQGIGAEGGMEKMEIFSRGKIEGEGVYWAEKRGGFRRKILFS